ncbi:alpha/beta fold hydrolase [Rodentibacter caecimuris]|uniref:Alpha/beta hydrolase n=1 Tax=Rodentibacter caecimuris TaxID=1796644 RepID=A0ABX3KVL0_9PAST|nr:alpha/beta hydrolase [Rodentibacter heylii]
MLPSKLLNYQFQPCPHPNLQPTLVFIHGLFGDMNNLGIIARAFSENYNILWVDLRNHGQSFHSDEMNYDLMAQDLAHLLDYLSLKHVILIGHSMGGKTAMKLTALSPRLVTKLIVIDIAPVSYNHNWHAEVFAGLFAVRQSKAQTRQQAKPILENHITDPSIVQFMLKSFNPHCDQYFRFNVSALFNNYANLMDWKSIESNNTPTLFIKGGLSSYIDPNDTANILAQFPNATSFTINACGHWAHAEKPEFVIRAIERFLNKNL